jgi:hypothetical protein
MGDSAAALRALLGQFSRGALLDQQRSAPRLGATAELLHALSHIPDDGSDEGFFDLLLLR